VTEVQSVVPAGAAAADADASARFDKVAARALEVGLRRVTVLAWRDLDDPEAGGSELHAHQLATIWAGGGLDVTLRTSATPGLPAVTQRDGYRVVRRAGRIGVFPRSILGTLLPPGARPDGLMEVWHGIPFYAPVWARCPLVSFVHHVHADTWKILLPPAMARVGAMLELKVAPPLYRKTRFVTPSNSTRDDVVKMLRADPALVTVAPNGVHPRFSPGGERSADPLVVAVGRLVPVKRFGMLIDALARVRERVPTLRALIVGDGFTRPKLEAKAAAAGAGAWLEMPGHLSDDELLDVYRRAWVLASTSRREGWNMTITEAAACGTPAVATNIVGHRDTVAHDVSGLLASPGDDFVGALTRLLEDDALRRRLGQGAVERARAFRWEATAATTLEALVEEAEARRAR